MIEKKFLVTDNMGIHARPASSIVKVSSKFKSDCKIIIDNKEANLKSIISLMSLVIKAKDTFLLMVEGIDEKEAYDSITKTIKENNIAKEV